MSTTSDRAALIARQGGGARYDAAEAPAGTLLLARRGTAYFARLLNGLSDDALSNSSARPGWTRAHVVAHVGYHARRFAQLIEGARIRGKVIAPDSTTSDSDLVTLGASLPARALRGLFDHSAIHLDVEWRDLPGTAWDAPISLPDGCKITARDTPLIRARTLWQSALDLDAGGRLADLPASLRA